MGNKSSPFTRWASAAVVAAACIVFVPPLAIDGRVSHLEYALLVLGSVLVIAIFTRNPVRSVPIPVLLVALLLVMAASTGSSFSRASTVRDVLTFSVIALAAIVLVQIATLNTLAIGVAASGLILVFWGLTVWMVSPETAFTSTGAFIGPYGNRNGFAYALLQSVPAALAARFAFHTGLVAKWLIVFLLCASIVATTSKTALLVLGAVLAAATVVALLRRRRLFAWILIGCALIVVVIGAANFDKVLALLGKGASINGRIPIWEALLPLIGQRPFVGYGWSMSWPVGAPPSEAVKSRLSGVVLFHAHNEMLNWLITTGVVGALLVLIIYVLVLWSGILILIKTNLVASSWIALGALVLILRGLSDISETLPQGWFVWVMLIAAAVRYLPEATGRPVSKFLAFHIQLPEGAGRHSVGVQK